ncbi:hypothetical protein [Dietzia sp. Die43]|uniref:hypothetical protein n=1 Tax=Dietzia sp. Die43 TaxID=2926011 RepID=UPI00211874F4|nr:hypothetical protein [Dietzia sp. Die43]
MAKVKFTRFSEPGEWSDLIEELLSDAVTGGRVPAFRDRCREFGIDTTTPLFGTLIADLAFIRPPDVVAQFVARVLGLEDRAGIDTFIACMRLTSAYARKLDSDPGIARTLVGAAASLAVDTGLGGIVVKRWVGVNERMLVSTQWTPEDIAATADNQPESVVYELLISDDAGLRELQLCGHASSRLGWCSAELMQLTTGNRRWRGPLASQDMRNVHQDLVRTVLLPQMDIDARFIYEHMSAVISMCPAEFREIAKDFLEGGIIYAAEMYQQFENLGSST